MGRENAEEEGDVEDGREDGFEVLYTGPLQPVCFLSAMKEKSFHLSSYTGVCRHSAGSSRRFILRRFTRNYERQCSRA